MQITWDDGGCLAGVDCLPFWWPTAVAGPQASGRNGRLRLCGRCSFGHGPSGSSYSVYTALFVFVCLFVFAGMPFISVDRPDGSSFLWHQPCQRCNYTTSVDTQKTRYKKLFTHVESHASAMSLLESGEQCEIKAINNNNNLCTTCSHSSK